MTSIDDVKSGNLLELYFNGRDAEFVYNNNEVKAVLDTFAIRVSQGIYKVDSIEEGKINGIDMANYEPLLIGNEWLTRLKAIPSEQSNIQIGKLYFKRTQLGLLHCNDKFEPLSGEKLIQYVHQLQNIHKEKTGEDLSILTT